MAARVYMVITGVQRGREGVDTLFGRLLDLAQREAVPCALIEAYSALRTRQLRIENAFVAAAKQAGMKPPEDAPRSFAIFGACTPGTTALTLDAKMVKAGREYLKQVADRRVKMDAALLQAYKDNVGFRTQSDQYLQMLAPYAQANTVEALPPPRNIGLLKLFYFIGGSPWNVAEAEKLRTLTVPGIEEAEVTKLFKDIGTTTDAVNDLVTASPPPKTGAARMPWWGWVLSALAVASAATGTIIAVKRYRYRGLSESFDEGEEGELPALASPKRRALPPRRRSR